VYDLPEARRSLAQWEVAEMERVGFGRKGAGILVLGVMLGALLVPRIASAVANVVTIQGSGSTNRAAVTKAHQIESAEAPPSAFREFSASSGDTSCVTFGAIPSDKGFIAKSVIVNVTLSSSTGFVVAQVWPNGSCSGSDMFSTPTKVVGEYSLQFEPGFAMAHGKHFSLKVAATGAVVGVYVFGYVVPSGDVPSTTPISH
jgi:hypothetical protein